MSQETFQERKRRIERNKDTKKKNPRRHRRDEEHTDFTRGPGGSIQPVKRLRNSGIPKRKTRAS